MILYDKMFTEEISRLTDKILEQKKYRQMGIPKTTVEDIISREAKPGLNEKFILKNARKKMHHLVADYLGDVDYDLVADWLSFTYAQKNENSFKDTCRRILNLHASTRERLTHLENFYQTIFTACGMPESILDLACGLNPFAMPWMDLPDSTQYHAYDINSPRIDLINKFFRYEHRPLLGEIRDILVDPPQQRADMAFFFKEAHRMEQRRKGSNFELWQALDVKYLIVSLPASSLNAQHDLRRQMRKLVETAINGLDWQVQEFQSGNEMIFCIQK